MIGHVDWRVEHLRFKDGELSAAYDWDSIVVERESVLVGGAAQGFTAASLAGDSWRQRPTLEESPAFLDDYQAARGRPFPAVEQQIARAALVYAMAYATRCEHSDAQLMPWGQPQAPPDSARAFVAAHTTELLPENRQGS